MTKDEREKRRPVPARKYANAVCLSCRKYIKIDLGQDTVTCPSCGKPLSAHEAATCYDYLLQLEQDKVAEAVESMTSWQYYIKKFKYYWRGSLTWHAVCVPVIALSVLFYYFAPTIYENPVVYFSGMTACVIEFMWLFWLIMPVTMDGMHEDIVRDELFGLRPRTRFRTVQIALVVIGLVLLVGSAAYDAITPPPSVPDRTSSSKPIPPPPEIELSAPALVPTPADETEA